MTRFSLQEASLLDLSGEFGPKASSQLHAHIKKSPSARAEYEQIKSEFALLCSFPQLDLPTIDAQRLSNEVKLGVRRQLREQKQQKNAETRRRYLLGALAGVSGLAACILVTLEIVTVRHNREQNRQQAVARAADSLRDFINADAENMTDVALTSLNVQLNSADALQQQWNPTENSGNRAKLLDLIDTTNDELDFDDDTGA